MVDCKPCSTPIASRAYLSNKVGTPFSDPFELPHLLGSLHYLTLTRLDIAYAINHIS